ncbi:fumarylacetoacetate hydrolase family protein [Ornithinimicrobium sp. F0845]|uniref:fumarylacetoacetate hydrolase family protein n=1 Tax=Ornithinimicrobium sp. F0845 TaxID=2926412 RepID=UPI001FF319D1|nr:fumarylacetoacetate hydrolase family protein [Ornithinimicrobium sp. F0845]MCK0112418.1 fumarylacetoacetate hydrolase family protein [Ornithinimicrobium sp. F0845]
MDAQHDPRFAGLPDRPGKIVAVHVSYASRADQRGRRPGAPSYFFKPSSSVAATGSEIVRPQGTELLAFEGEVALVIGEPARWISAERAWQHVAWVTAANDFGLYDLRANDKGSNVRSKGGDGYTPIGPALIDARAIDPAALRLRTWVNGEPVQDDSTGGLIFPLAQFVADLSQHFTLETGDVVLTGTPAGSTVVQPGDLVEVEVDAPASGLTSGRLQTRVVQSEGPSFDESVGSLPAVDDAQRVAAWGSEEAAGLVPAAGGDAEAVAGDGAPAGDTTTAGLTSELRAKLERCPVAGLAQRLRGMGLNNVSIDGVRPLPGAGKIVGTAKTLRFVANREDLFRSHGGGYNAQKRAFDAVGEGEVIVIEARGDSTAGTLGDVLALRARARGAAGVITDGAVRDHDAVAAAGVPVYSSGAHPAVLGRRHVPWDHDITIVCGGATVQPGDIIVADADGALVIPPAVAEEAVDAALAKEDEDAWVAERVSEGEPIEGLFPMNSAWRERYEAERDGTAGQGGAAPQHGAPG